MHSRTRILLLEVAGYLRLIESGLPANRTEAKEINDKIAKILEDDITEDVK